MQHSFKNTFPLDRKTKESLAGESENGKKIISTSRKKSLNKRILNRKSVPFSGNEEFAEEYLFTRWKNCLQ